MASGDNPFVPKSIANRIWFHLMGRGIVDPVDDFRDSNPSANDDLLDALAKDINERLQRQAHLIRARSRARLTRTYQLSAQTNKFNQDDIKYFSHAVTKLLTAEQLFDALCYVTDVPEKYAGMPLGTRAAQLPDGEVNHPFLKTFRPAGPRTGSAKNAPNGKATAISPRRYSSSTAPPLTTACATPATASANCSPPRKRTKRCWRSCSW